MNAITGQQPRPQRNTTGSTAWRELALCAQTDPELFFPLPLQSAAQAKGICGRCEVRAECLTYALEHVEAYGIWGGLTYKERRAVANRARSGQGRAA